MSLGVGFGVSDTQARPTVSPFLLAEVETQRLEPEQASWSMRRKPCLEDRGGARNQIPQGFRKWENGGQTRNQTQSSAWLLLLPWLPATPRRYC